MKIRAREPFFKLLVTIMGLQVSCVAFAHFREQLLLNIAQGFMGIALILMGYLLYTERAQVWSGGEAIAQKASLVKLLKTSGLFLFFLLFTWQVNYLSLYESQPLMYTPEDLPIRYDIGAGDLLALTLRLVLQTWVLAIGLALVFNRLPKNGEFGFIRGQYKKLSTFAFYISNFAGGAVSTVLLFALGLLTLDVAKFICKSAGSDVMNVSQFDLVVLLFSLYLFNIATGFTKRLKQWGEHPGTSMAFVLLVQLAFVLVVYCLVRVMMVYLPENSVYALMQPFHFDFIDPVKFPHYWHLFVTALSFFMVPLLAHYFYHACQGEKVFNSVLRLCVIPICLCVGILQAIPSAQPLFLQWLPSVQMIPVELNNITSRYEISWVSYFSVLILLCLVLMLQRSSKLIQSIVDIMPEQVGRRARRVKALYARSYPFFIAMISLYLLAGVVVSLYFTSLFLMATMVGLVLCFVAGIKQREA